MRTDSTAYSIDGCLWQEWGASFISYFPSPVYTNNPCNVEYTLQYSCIETQLWNILKEKITNLKLKKQWQAET